jgi:hypothetical protein
MESLSNVADFAARLKVHRSSIYQSLPGAKKPKLGTCVPEPIRLGTALRWTHLQIDQFILSLTNCPGGRSETEVSAPVQRRRGRPRKGSARGAA